MVGNNLIISLIELICLYISHAMHLHDIHQSFLSEINVDRMFAEKECLGTTDRFLWHGGIQNHSKGHKELCIVLDI